MHPGEELNFINVKAAYIKGAGRFEGIKGDLILEYTGTRSLPSR
jgi:hypothetical protein